MKKLTLSEINPIYSSSADVGFMHGYNTCVDLANAEIEQLTKERDEWKVKCDKLISQQKPLSPEMKDLLSKPSVTLADLLNPIRERINKLEQRITTDEQALDTLYCDIKELRELLTATIDTMTTIDEHQKLLEDEQTAQRDFANLLGENLKNAVMDGDTIEISTRIYNVGVITKIK
jgi:uncharacterized coiled-coil DUF342 family protein